MARAARPTAATLLRALSELRTLRALACDGPGSAGSRFSGWQLVLLEPWGPAACGGVRLATPGEPGEAQAPRPAGPQCPQAALRSRPELLHEGRF